MSKYTTEVRYICEQESGLKGSVGYNTVDKVISDSIPGIFDFDFPIFDENYREVICTKILRHYYTREIGFETVGLWKLKLQTKLCEIMPYYNQLYESELIKFNPLYDTDLNTTHVGEKDSQLDKNDNRTELSNSNRETSGSENYNRTNSGTENSAKEINQNENYNKTYNEEENNSKGGNKSIENQKISNEKIDENYNKTADNISISNFDELNNKIGNKQDSNSFSENESKDTNKGETGIKLENETNNTNKIENSDYAENSNNSEASSRTINNDTTNAKNNQHYDLYSDTPQGALNGVDSEEYLTNARKIKDATDDVATSNTYENGTLTGENSKFGSGRNNQNEQAENVKNETNSVSSNENISGNKSGSGSVLTNENEIESKTGNNKNTNSENEDTSKTGEKNINEIGSEANRYEETETKNKSNKETEVNFNKYNEGNTTVNASNEDSSRSSNLNDNENRNTIENKIGKDVFNSTESYVLHVIGKQGGTSFSKMLKEFRDTFLNIDMDVIHSLSDLFMNIW